MELIATHSLRLWLFYKILRGIFTKVTQPFRLRTIWKESLREKGTQST